MREDWAPLIFTLVDYKDTGTRILSSLDEVQTLLDDQIVKVQTIRGSLNVEYMRSRHVLSTCLNLMLTLSVRQSSKQTIHFILHTFCLQRAFGP